MKRLLSDLLDSLLAPIGAVMMLPMMLASHTPPKAATGEALDKLIEEQQAKTPTPTESEVVVDPTDGIPEIIEFKLDEN